MNGMGGSGHDLNDEMTTLHGLLLSQINFISPLH